ncbi:hypothetical protein M0P98_06210, partial [bacterium]|nr:hypothetical protein [bacterium]
MRLVKNILLILILTFSFIGNINCENHNKEEGGTKMVFPDKEWKRGNPEDFGFTQETLNLIDEKMRAASADGVLIRNGYLIAEWNYAGP